MGDTLDPLLSRKENHEGGHQSSDDPTLINAGMVGKSSQLIQCILLFVPRAFDAQQCFITTFTDSSSYPSNILTDWSLEDASPLLTSLPAAAFYVGCLFSGFLLTPLADTRLGRKNLLLVSCLLMSLSGLLTSFSPNIFVYSALRLVSGFGRAPISSATLALATELVGPRWRSYAGLLGFVLFSLGFASLPAIAYLSRHSSWRNMYTWTSLPALLYCAVVYFFVRESPRWIQLETKTGGTYSALSALVSRQWARRRLALVMALSFGLGVAYYGMPLGLGSLSFNLYLSVAMEALIELPATLAAFCFIGTVNRKPSLLAMTALSGLCSIACGAVSSGSSWLQVALELVAFLIGSTAVDIGLIYVSELFPTCVRNSALAMTRQAAVLGAGVGAVLAAVGESCQNELISYGGFGVLILVCGVFVLWLPDTRRTEPCDTMDEEEWKHKGNQLAASI